MVCVDFMTIISNIMQNLGANISNMFKCRSTCCNHTEKHFLCLAPQQTKTVAPSVESPIKNKRKNRSN